MTLKQFIEAERRQRDAENEAFDQYAAPVFLGIAVILGCVLVPLLLPFWLAGKAMMWAIPKLRITGEE